MTHDPRLAAVSRRKLIHSIGVAGALATAGCADTAGGGTDDGSSGNGDAGGVTGSIRISGSSTVYPISVAASEEFRTQVSDEVEFAISRDGSTGGFENFFLDGDSDINGASRPILDEEVDWARETGFEPIEIQCAGDALTVAANPDADWVDCMTIDELQQIWHPDMENERWSDVDPDWPDEPFDLYGPASTSGTFDFWTETVVGELRTIRQDFEGTEEDDLIAEGIGGNPYAFGYLPYAYYDNNPEGLKAIAVDAGDGCSPPSLEAASAGTYPLARPIFWYVNSNKLQEKEALQEFMRFAIELSGNQRIVSEEIGYVAMNDQAVQTNLDAIEDQL